MCEVILMSSAVNVNKYVGLEHGQESIWWQDGWYTSPSVPCHKACILLNYPRHGISPIYISLCRRG